MLASQSYEACSSSCISSHHLPLFIQVPRNSSSINKMAKVLSFTLITLLAAPALAAPVESAFPPIGLTVAANGAVEPSLTSPTESQDPFCYVYRGKRICKTLHLPSATTTAEVAKLAKRDDDPWHPHVECCPYIGHAMCNCNVATTLPPVGPSTPTSMTTSVVKRSILPNGPGDEVYGIWKTQWEGYASPVARAASSAVSSAVSSAAPDYLPVPEFDHAAALEKAAQLSASMESGVSVRAALASGTITPDAKVTAAPAPTDTVASMSAVSAAVSSMHHLYPTMTKPTEPTLSSQPAVSSTAVREVELEKRGPNFSKPIVERDLSDAELTPIVHPIATTTANAVDEASSNKIKRGRQGSVFANSQNTV